MKCENCNGTGQIHLFDEDFPLEKDIVKCVVCRGTGQVDDTGYTKLSDTTEIEPMRTSPEPGHTFIPGIWRVTRTQLPGHPDTPVMSYEISEDAELVNSPIPIVIGTNHALTATQARIAELEAANSMLREAGTDAVAQSLTTALMKSADALTAANARIAELTAALESVGNEAKWERLRGGLLWKMVGEKIENIARRALAGKGERSEPNL